MKALIGRRQQGFSIVAVIVSLAFVFVVGGIAFISITSSLGEAVYAVDVGEWMAEQEDAETLKPPPFSNKFLYLFLALSVILDIAAGYIAGRIGRDAPIFHAAVVGIVVIVLGVILQPGAEEDPFPSWFNAVSYLATVPLMMIGGWMASRGR